MTVIVDIYRNQITAICSIMTCAYDSKINLHFLLYKSVHKPLLVPLEQTGSVCKFSTVLFHVYFIQGLVLVSAVLCEPQFRCILLRLDRHQCCFLSNGSAKTDCFIRYYWFSWPTNRSLSLLTSDLFLCLWATVTTEFVSRFFKNFLSRWFSTPGEDKDLLQLKNLSSFVSSNHFFSRLTDIPCLERKAPFHICRHGLQHLLRQSKNSCGKYMYLLFGFSGLFQICIITFCCYPVSLSHDMSFILLQIRFKTSIQVQLKPGIVEAQWSSRFRWKCTMEILQDLGKQA